MRARLLLQCAVAIIVIAATCLANDAPDLLDAVKDATPEQVIEIALSPQVWHAELWQEHIRRAAPGSTFGKMLAMWDRRDDADRSTTSRRNRVSLSFPARRNRSSLRERFACPPTGRGA